MAEDRRSSKCDGCAAVVEAGGTPWCVNTCPSHALMYGERDQILLEAHVRASALKVRYPNAQVYGETEAGGLGMIMVLPDSPDKLELPVNPDVPLALDAWQKVVQPASLGLTGLSIAVTGLLAVIARRIHLQATLKLRYPNAQIYGEQEFGGLGVIMVLPDSSDKLELPQVSELSTVLDDWRQRRRLVP